MNASELVSLTGLHCDLRIAIGIARSRAIPASMSVGEIRAAKSDATFVLIRVPGDMAIREVQVLATHVT